MEISIRMKGKGMPESPSQPPPDFPATTQFAAALECVQAPLRRFVRGMVGDDEQAQDIVQDAFVDAWRATMQGRAPFDGAHDDQELRRWLFHVAYQRAVSALRHSSALRVESLDVFPPPSRRSSISQRDLRTASPRARRCRPPSISSVHKTRHACSW